MRTTDGFTLIELLIVVVIIGILAAIAIPSYRGTKSKAFVSAIKSDLRNLATAEEAYFVDEVGYTATIGNLTFNSSNAVTVSIEEAAINSWRATGFHSGLAGVVCELYYGSTTGTTATAEGLIACND